MLVGVYVYFSVCARLIFGGTGEEDRGMRLMQCLNLIFAVIVVIVGRLTQHAANLWFKLDWFLYGW